MVILSLVTMDYVIIAIIIEKTTIYVLSILKKSKIDKEFINKFLEELSVFYVGATRCRKNVIFATNKLRKKLSR